MAMIQMTLEGIIIVMLVGFIVGMILGVSMVRPRGST
jgi:hypothetical protein